MSSWQYLPTELIEMIAAPLCARDWARLGLVCRDWRAATRSGQQLARRGWTAKNFGRSHDMVCSVCGMRRAKVRATTRCRECAVCRRADVLLTQGRAMREYRLTKARLREVPHIELLNPYGSGGNMRLFRASAIQRSLRAPNRGGFEAGGSGEGYQNGVRPGE